MINSLAEMSVWLCVNRRIRQLYRRHYLTILTWSLLLIILVYLLITWIFLSFPSYLVILLRRWFQRLYGRQIWGPTVLEVCSVIWVANEFDCTFVGDISEARLAAMLNTSGVVVVVEGRWCYFFLFLEPLLVGESNGGRILGVREDRLAHKAEVVLARSSHFWLWWHVGAF